MCDDDLPHLITAVAITSANEHEVTQTQPTHDRLKGIDILPSQYLVDSAYISADILVESYQQYGVQIIGPPRPDMSWQARSEDAFDYTAFEIDWDNQRVRCPNGRYSIHWYDIDNDGKARSPGVKVRFSKQDCSMCSDRKKCTRSKDGRRMRLTAKPLYDALEAARRYATSEEGAALYKKRAGVEGTISQAVRAFGFR